MMTLHHVDAPGIVGNSNPVAPKTEKKATGFGKSVRQTFSNVAKTVKSAPSNIKAARKSLSERAAEVKESKTSRAEILNAKLKREGEAFVLAKKNPKLAAKLNALEQARNAIQKAFEDSTNTKELKKSLQSAMSEAKTAFEKKSLFGFRTSHDAEMMGLLSSCFMEEFNDLAKLAKDQDPKLMQQLLHVQSELQAEGLLTLGKSPEYKSASKLMDSIAKNVKLLNDLNTSKLSNDDTKQLFNNLKANCADIIKNLGEQYDMLQKAMTDHPVYSKNREARLQAELNVYLLIKEASAMEDLVQDFIDEVATDWQGSTRKNLVGKMDALRVKQGDIIAGTNSILRTLEANTSNLQNKAIKNKMTSVMAAIGLTPVLLGGIVTSLAGIACGAFATATGIGAFGGIPTLVASCIGLAASASMAYAAFTKIKNDITGQNNLFDAYSQDLDDLKLMQAALEKSIETDPVLELLTGRGSTFADKLAGRNETFAGRMAGDLDNTFGGNNTVNADTIFQSHPEIIKSAITNRNRSDAEVNAIFMQLSPNIRLKLLEEMKPTDSDLKSKDTAKAKEAQEKLATYHATLKKLHPLVVAQMIEASGGINGGTNRIAILLSDIFKAEQPDGKPRPEAAIRMAFIFAAIDSNSIRVGQIENFQVAHKLGILNNLKNPLNRSKQSIATLVENLRSDDFKTNNKDLLQFLSLRAKDPETLISVTTAVVSELLMSNKKETEKRQDTQAAEALLTQLDRELGELDRLDQSNTPRQFFADQVQGRIADNIERVLGDKKSDYQVIAQNMPRFATSDMANKMSEAGFHKDLLPAISTNRLKALNISEEKQSQFILNGLNILVQSPEDNKHQAIDNMRKMMNAFPPASVANAIQQHLAASNNDKAPKQRLLTNLAKVFRVATPEARKDLLKEFIGDADLNDKENADLNDKRALLHALYGESPSMYFAAMESAGLEYDGIKTAKRLLAEGFATTAVGEGAVAAAGVAAPVIAVGGALAGVAAGVSIGALAAIGGVRRHLAEADLRNQGAATRKGFFAELKKVESIGDKIDLLNDEKYAGILGVIQQKDAAKSIAKLIMKDENFAQPALETTNTVEAVKAYRAQNFGLRLMSVGYSAALTAAKDQIRKNLNLQQYIQNKDGNEAQNLKPQIEASIKNELASLIAINHLKGKAPKAAGEPLVDKVT